MTRVVRVPFTALRTETARARRPLDRNDVPALMTCVGRSVPPGAERAVRHARRSMYGPDNARMTVVGLRDGSDHGLLRGPSGPVVDATP